MDLFGHNNYNYSILHFECHFLNFKSQSTIPFSRSCLPRSVEKGPIRLRLEMKIEWHSKLNGCSITVSAEIATPSKSAKSRNLDFSVSRGTNSDSDFVGRAAVEVFRPAAAERHQGRSQSMRGKIRGFIDSWRKNSQNLSI